MRQTPMGLFHLILSLSPPIANKGETYEESRTFRQGLTFSKKWSRLAVPIPLAMVVDLVSLSCIMADAIKNFDTTDWAIKVADIGFCCNCFGHCCVAYFFRESIDHLSDSVDIWWSHKLLDDVGKSLKKKNNEHIYRFNRYFHNGMNIMLLFYVLTPFIKLVIGRPFSELYIYKMVTPLSSDKWWAVLMVYFLQVSTLFFMFNSYSGITAYIMRVASTIAFQTRLVGVSIITVKDRATELAQRVQTRAQDPERWYKIYCDLLHKEIATSAAHYQHIYRNAKEMCRIFTKIVDIVYYSGMSLVIMFGVKMATEKENKAVIMQCFLFINVVITNQYLFTTFNDRILEEVASLQNAVYNSPWYQLPVSSQKEINIFQMMVKRLPTLSNLLGIQADKELFSKVINTTYGYITALMAMDL